jgi:hypothetical protein
LRSWLNIYPFNRARRAILDARVRHGLRLQLWGHCVVGLNLGTNFRSTLPNNRHPCTPKVKSRHEGIVAHFFSLSWSRSRSLTTSLPFLVVHSLSSSARDDCYDTESVLRRFLGLLRRVKRYHRAYDSAPLSGFRRVCACASDCDCDWIKGEKKKIWMRAAG